MAPYIPDIRTDISNADTKLDIDQAVESSITKQDEAEALPEDKIQYIRDNKD